MTPRRTTVHAPVLVKYRIILYSPTLTSFANKDGQGPRLLIKSRGNARLLFSREHGVLRRL
jgi:hypothetical protein